jgi:hypothetical protein
MVLEFQIHLQRFNVNSNFITTINTRKDSNQSNSYLYSRQKFIGE